MQIHEDIRFQRLIERMEKLHRDGQTEEMKKVLDELQTLAEVEQDDIGLTAAYFYRDVIYGSKPGTKEYMQYVKKALLIAKAKNIPYYKMKSGNTLGIMYTEISDFHTSLEYYLSALNIAIEHSEYAYAGIVLNNVGNLFVWLEEYEEAALYLERAYQKCIEENQNDRELIVLVTLNLIEIYSELENYEKLKALEAQKIVTLNREELEVIEGFKLINDAKQLVKNKQEEAGREKISVFMKLSERILDNMYTFRCYLNALKIGMEMKDSTLCSKLLVRMEEMQKQLTMGSFSYAYTAIKVQYYETFKEQLKLDRTAYYDEYYNQSQNRIRQLRNTYARSMTVKIALEEAESENRDAHLQNEQLQKDKERDIFTNLYNKVSTERHVRKAIANKKERKKQALILIDIDLFKRINDNYGHGYGDKVIFRVAELIESMEEAHKITGRFGGDEFLVFLDKKNSIEEIEASVSALLKKVRKDIKLPDEKIEKITLSIGICVLGSSMQFEEAFARADKALYKAKELGRDRYVLDADAD